MDHVQIEFWGQIHKNDLRISSLLPKFQNFRLRRALFSGLLNDNESAHQKYFEKVPYTFSKYPGMMQ